MELRPPPSHPPGVNAAKHECRRECLREVKCCVSPSALDLRHEFDDDFRAVTVRVHGLIAVSQLREAVRGGAQRGGACGVDVSR